MILRRATATVLISIGVAAALFEGCAASDPSPGTTRATGSGTGTGTGNGTGGSTGATTGGSTGGGTTTGGGGGPPPINPGNPDAGADVKVSADAACANEARKGEKKQTDLYMMMDNSGSMDMVDMGQTLSRWDNLAQAIPVFVNDPVNAGMQLGLDFFPEGAIASCNIPDYTMANVPIDFIPGMNNMQSQAIISAVQGRARTGGTPTTPALSGALQAAKTWQMAHPERSLSVLFLTDGQPTGCDRQTNSVPGAAAIAQQYSTGTPPIKTYVLGVGPDTGNLDQIAAAGGTTMAYMVTNGGAAALAAALAAIRKSTLTCDYNLPNLDGGKLDSGKVVVQVRTGPTGMFIEVPRVQKASDCTGNPNNPTGIGWYYDDNNVPTKISLCPQSCGPLQITDGSEVNIILGCEPAKIPPPN